MVRPLQYWTMPGIDDKVSGRVPPVAIAIAKDFFQQEFPEPDQLSDKELDDRLWTLRQNAIAEGDVSTQHKAELCLRCRIAHLCWHSCGELCQDFALSVKNKVSTHDLFIQLDYDDGKVANLTDNSLNKANNSYQPLTLEILKDYRPDRDGKGSSLPQFTKLKVRRDPKLRQFLLENDLQLEGSWAILNRASLASLSPQEQQIIRAFRSVYQRDRRQQFGSRYDGHCPDPTPEQKQEILQKLRSFGIPINSIAELEKNLEKIAKSRREEKICRLKGFISAASLNNLNLENEEWQLPEDEESTNPLEVVAEWEFQSSCERWNLLQFCQQQLEVSLDWAVAQSIRDRITFLSRKPKRSDLANRVESALSLLYIESKSLADIASALNLQGQPQVSLMLEPQKLVQNIQDRTIQHLLQAVLAKAIQLGFTQDPPESDYFNGLIQEITSFVAAKVFQEAFKELRTAKNRSMDSLLAERICLYLNSPKEDSNE
jgi:hypothetical protein